MTTGVRLKNKALVGGGVPTIPNVPKVRLPITKGAQRQRIIEVAIISTVRGKKENARRRGFKVI